MRKLLLLVLTHYCISNVNAQKYSSINNIPNAPIIAFVHNSASEMMEDKEFVKNTAKIYLDFLEPVITSNQLEDSAITTTVIRSIAQANIILGNYTQAEKYYELYLAKRPDFKLVGFPNLAFLMVKNGKEQSYKRALLNKAGEFSLHIKERDFHRYYAPDFPKDNPVSILNYASSDSSRYPKTINANLSFFQKKDKKLNLTEIIKLIQVYSNRLVADAMRDDIYLMNRDVREEIKAVDAKWLKIWETKLYKFSATDKPLPVVACNYQVFNKDLFPAKNIWTNPGEITGNNIDDDHNGIIDDIHGYQYKYAKAPAKEPVAVTFKDSDTTAVAALHNLLVKNFSYTTSLKQYIAEQFDHGNMAVELMIKNNPTVQFMSIEHNQYTGWSRTLPTTFTDDTRHNQYLIDSVISLFTKSWMEMAIYCNEKNVRVVEINSIGGTEDDLIFEGCGKTKEEAKAFAKYLFTKYNTDMTAAYAKAPNTLFINAAGNDNLNVDSIPNIGTAIHLPNVLVVGALFKDFTNAYSDHGNGVDVFAPAHFYLPVTKAYADRNYTSNGCSAAAPVVANLAIQLFALDSKMTAAKAKQLIIEGADKEPYEKGINVINPKKSVALLKRN